MTRFAAFIPAAAIALLSQTPAFAGPSYDCGTARLAAEKLVCQDRGLSRLDRNMAGLYADTIGQARAVSDARAVRTVRGSQREFLAERNACGWDYGCIRGCYRAQAQTLRRFLRDLD